MSNFAEKIIESMVDAEGKCGERGLSEKQFRILSEKLDISERRNAGGWSGNCGGGVSFTITIYDGYIGKYHVKLQDFNHFNNAYTVKSIEPWCEELPDMTRSEFKYAEKMRVEMDVQCVEHRTFESCYDGWNYTLTHIYTFVDDSENCFVWFASKEQPIAIGEKIKLRATVKAHKEYRGIKQTVITRGKVL